MNDLDLAALIDGDARDALGRMGRVGEGRPYLEELLKLRRLGLMAEVDDPNTGRESVT
jgi:hypothetical protein